MAQLVPVQIGGQYIDFSNRLAYSVTVDASPSAGTKTTIAHLSIPSGVTIIAGVLLVGQAAFTVGTSGVSATLDIAHHGGTAIGTTGAATVTAGDLYAPLVQAFDTSLNDGQRYDLELTIGSGAAASTVSSVLLWAVLF